MADAVPGPRPSTSDRELAREIRESYRTELERVRKAAADWRTGLAALITLVTTVSIIKGQQAITGLSDHNQIVLGIFAVGALVCAVAGAMCSMLAAFGLPSEQPSETIRDFRRHEAQYSRRRLDGAIVLTLMTIGFFALAVGITWYGAAREASVLSVSTGDTTVCGKVKDVNGTTLTLEGKGAPTEVRLNKLTAMKIVDSC